MSEHEQWHDLAQQLRVDRDRLADPDTSLTELAPDVDHAAS